MRRLLLIVLAGLLYAGSARAQGLLIPAQNDVPPLSMSRHEVKIAIEDQVALTHVTQTFRNDTSQALEATYVFPVPKDASVKKFVMWVDGKEVQGELVEADKARTIYTDIVRRTQDPGLLEYIGSNLLRVRVFPVPARGEQKLAVSYTSVATSDSGLIEYIYPLKADGKTTRNLEKFSLEATLKAQQPIQNVYSPTHAVTVTRPNDRQAVVRYEGQHSPADKDFQLYYTAAAKDVGLTALVHRPDRTVDGHFMLLISPRAELSRTQEVPRDVVFVLDTSGSMQGKRIQQARNALKFCLRNLGDKDRFGVVHFATSVTRYNNELLAVTSKQIVKAQSWVDGLEAVGSTNIDEALATALAMRTADAHRNFTIVFFTDGQPTIGETNPEQIVKNAVAKNSANTRIFTFGVGDDVNAVLLDQLADKTRSVCTYVRENEDIEAKVSGFYSKISHPVLTNLKLTVGNNVTLTEVYPPQLPDLFHGSQLVVLGRYKNGKGHAKVTLTGMVGGEPKEFTYDVPFPRQTNKDKAFVEDLWARRKVGYLLDQIRTNGANKELTEEVVALAKKHGITTPYTSYLVVPDAATPVARANPAAVPANLYAPPHLPPTPPPAASSAPRSGGVNLKFGAAAPPAGSQPYPWGNNFLWGAFRGGQPPAPDCPVGCPAPSLTVSESAVAPTDVPGAVPVAQSGKAGVDLAIVLNELRTQSQVAGTTVRQAAGRKCVHINGVWTDDGFDAKMTVVKIKAMSEAYFRMLERHPEMREVFLLGNRLVWVTPSQVALVIDTADGQEKITDEEIDRLFVKK